MEPCLVLIMLWFCGGAREPSGVAHLALPSSDWLCESHALRPWLAVRMGSQWWSWVTGGWGAAPEVRAQRRPVPMGVARGQPRRGGLRQGTCPVDGEEPQESEC